VPSHDAADEINLNATCIGAPEEANSRVETGLTAALSNEFDKNWTGVVEWSGTRRRGMQSTAQLLAGVAYSPDKKVDRRWLRQGIEQGNAGLVVLYRLRYPYRQAVVSGAWRSNARRYCVRAEPNIGSPQR
jgi:hypothetical protein